MGSFSLFHWIVVLAAVMLLFGTKRIPQAMGDIARGMKQFRSGLREEETPEVATAPVNRAPELPRDTVSRG
ncbi:preprotein translocase subunit TatA [Skermanella stibiiresistens SB22]|uniref:Sec-independent protein translocase protein TatA n=1 Tax=Skermanella stibiiresistens SB22 TaxID=1385369 RepID=W9H202_9PROT|nr:twin-arginine translocase TatA/TatE family subunit [Skermanella stibiiresistens]EWY38732.1 preprotein translocase subunit TatA [Skermanella stibiiresistens SB22]